MWQAEVVGLAGAHAPRHARTLLRLFRRLGLRVALSAFDVLQVEVEVPGLKPRVLEADAVAEAGEEGAGGVLLSSVAVPFPARGRSYRGAPPQVLLDSVAGLAVVAEAQARDAAVVVSLPPLSFLFLICLGQPNDTQDVRFLFQFFGRGR